MSHSSYEDGIRQGETFNVEPGEPGSAVNNENLAMGTQFKVIAGTGEVSVLNAAGKNLTISNMLGQTIESKSLNSDNVTVKAPKGIILVSVDGEKTVKAIVK